MMTLQFVTHQNALCGLCITHQARPLCIGAHIVAVKKIPSDKYKPQGCNPKTDDLKDLQGETALIIEFTPCGALLRRIFPDAFMARSSMCYSQRSFQVAQKIEEAKIRVNNNSTVD